MHHRGKALGLIVAAAALLLVFEPQARAAFIETLEQSGSNVVATGSGTIDLSGLSLSIEASGAAGIQPNQALISTGAFGNEDLYSGVTGPSSFGSGALTRASSSSGDIVALDGIESYLFLPTGYTSGSSLSDTATYDSTTFATLGLTPGTYVWTWGTVGDDSFTLDIVSVPEPPSLALFAPALLGLAFFYRRKRVAVG